MTHDAAQMWRALEVVLEWPAGELDETAVEDLVAFTIDGGAQAIVDVVLATAIVARVLARALAVFRDDPNVAGVAMATAIANTRATRPAGSPSLRVIRSESTERTVGGELDRVPAERPHASGELE